MIKEKIMKNIITVLFVVLLLGSCSDILEEKPQAIAVETFYNTPSEIEAGVAAIYSPLRGWDCYSGTYLPMLEVSSDMFQAGRGSWAQPSEYQGLNSTNVGRVQNIWRCFYLSIRNANLIIKNVPNAKSTNDEEKNQYIAEARFLRAFSYFQLVRCWGSVPLRNENNMSEQSLSRSSVEDIYQFIISDLENAETYLPDQISVAGHPSKWSAKTLLADVYFSMNNYDKASEKSKEVIDSNVYSLVEVKQSSDFENLYGAAVNNTSEEIFYLKYVEEDYFEFALFLHGVGREYINVDGYLALYSNENYSVYKEWDDKDLRKVFNWYKYDKFDPGTILCKKYTDKEGLNPRNDYPAYRYADCLLIYAEASCRATNSPTVEGVEALNKVHRRAYGYPSTQPSPVDFQLKDYNKDSFIDLCMKERGYETVGESKRWFDLKRSGLAEHYVMLHRGQSIDQKHYLWPIPVAELNYNEAITDQNPGY